MILTSLRTVFFRNLADDEIDINGKDVFLVGENGQGKTNFLEALYFCSYGASFRGVRDGELSRNGERNFSAALTVKDASCARLLVKYEGGKKSLQIDGKRVEDRKDMLSAVPCIVFCHEDMDFVAGSPERRRWFFDQCLSLYDPVYLDDLRRYRRVLKTRNRILKENNFRPAAGLDEVLDALDLQVALYGSRLMEKRETAARLFSEVFSPLHRDVSGIGDVGVRYIPSWKDGEAGAVEALLRERRGLDIAAGLSLSGPHRDRYVFNRGGAEFAGKASTGQRRLLALLLRVAQAHRFSRMTGKNPVLLLDDVLLEMDGEKRRRFLSVMPEYDQAFFTFLPEEPFENYRKSGALIYTVYEGCIRARGEA
ncbi:MAG: DNA replication and repair protein RecF [Treponema sp.]|jgi:DNA replication and repair protein RecF|nr:DNA replication and repair protein RecF [Treponema sp.]